MFIHSVYFTLKPELTAEDVAAFEGGLASLRAVETVRALYVGTPAATTRPVVDRGYSYALIVHFDDLAGHNVYQDHPVHLAFAQSFSSYWSGIKVYDCD